MLKDIYANLQINKYDIRGMGWIILGIFIVGEIISAVMMVAFGDMDEYVSIGLILAAMAAVAMPLFGAMGQYSAGFELALKSGATRRRYMRSQTIVSLIQCLLAIAAVLVCQLIDMGVYNLFFDKVPYSIDIIRVIPLWVYAAVPLLSTAIALIFGASLEKFGKKASYGVLGLYFLVIFIVGRISPAMEGNSTNILDKAIFVVYTWIISVGMVPILWICAGVLVALAVVAYAVMLRMPVKA